MDSLDMILDAALLLAGMSAGGPQDALAPGVRSGRTLLEKKQFAHCEGIGEVTDIALGRVDGEDRQCLVLAGTHGYALLDPKTAEVQTLVSFEATMPAPFWDAAVRCRIVDADGDGDFEFTRLAAHWVGRTSLHGTDGKTIWAYPPTSPDPMDRIAINSTFCEDIDGDDKLDFLLTFNASQEVHRVDHAGKLVWSQEWKDQIDDVVFLDVDRDGHKDIVYVDGKALVARNGMGKELAQTTLPGKGYVNALHFLCDLVEPSKNALVVGSYVSAGKLAGQNYHLVETDAKSVRGSVKHEDIEHLLNNSFVAFL